MEGSSAREACIRPKAPTAVLFRLTPEQTANPFPTNEKRPLKSGAVMQEELGWGGTVRRRPQPRVAAIAFGGGGGGGGAKRFKTMSKGEIRD